jgi:rRNA maturation RNase YbeY
MFAIKKTIRGLVPRLPFEDMARAVLGAGYELSLVVCGDDLAQRMNIEYRKKSYRPNVLSFPLSKSEGEIFLNVRCAEREARKYGVSVRDRLALLFVHGLFHLKGLKHGDAMERAEQRVLGKLKV